MLLFSFQIDLLMQIKRDNWKNIVGEKGLIQIGIASKALSCKPYSYLLHSFQALYFIRKVLFDVTFVH